MKRWLREPLLHFLAIGAVLWAASSLMDEPAGPKDDELVVTEGRIEQLVAVFLKTRQRLPTRSELDGLIEDWIREELAYREGASMGLDRDDTIVRRRVRQKLEFFVEGLTDQLQPGEDELQAFLTQNADDFRSEPTLSFRHVFLNPNARGASLDADAAELRKRLASDPDVDLYAVGDRLLLDREFRDTPLREVCALFGLEFAEALPDLDVGRWTGPLRSGYGVHLVSLDALTPGRLPELSEVRDAVLREWENDARDRALAEFYATMRSRYEVRVEWPEVEAEVDESP